MNTDKLKVGMEVKNYKELCQLLSVEELKGGNSKKSQLKEMARYFNYEKKGHKFIIKDIFEVPLPPDNNITKYIPQIERLLLHIIFKNGAENVLYINKSKLYETLSMINEKYTQNKYNKMKLATNMEISPEVVRDFYNTSDDLLDRNINQAIKSLENQSLIKKNDVFSVCEMIFDTDVSDFSLNTIDKHGDVISNEEVITKVKRRHRRATENETTIILALQREQLQMRKCKNISEVYSKGMIKEFYRCINDYLRNQHNIEYYYNSYEFIFNIDQITEAYIENDSFLMEKEDFKHNSKQLNNEIKLKMMELADKRSMKSKSLHELDRTSLDYIRMDEEYKKDINLLISSLVVNYY